METGLTENEVTASCPLQMEHNIRQTSPMQFFKIKITTYQKNTISKRREFTREKAQTDALGKDAANGGYY